MKSGLMVIYLIFILHSSIIADSVQNEKSAEHQRSRFLYSCNFTSLIHNETASSGLTWHWGSLIRNRVVLNFGLSYLTQFIGEFLYDLAPRELFIENYYLVKNSPAYRIGVGVQLGYFRSSWRTSEVKVEGFLADYYPAEHKTFYGAIPSAYFSYGKRLARFNVKCGLMLGNKGAFSDYTSISDVEDFAAAFRISAGVEMVFGKLIRD